MSNFAELKKQVNYFLNIFSRLTVSDGDLKLVSNLKNEIQNSKTILDKDEYSKLIQKIENCENILNEKLKR